MKFTLSWLQEHISLDEDASKIGEKLTDLGLEIENFTKNKYEKNKFLIVKIINISQHPNADRLKVCKVTDGNSSYELVCGAKNLKIDMRSVFAPIGSYIPGIKLKLEKKNIRGITGEGMLCSEKELGISDDQEGIIELSNNYEVGSEFFINNSLNEDIFEIALTPNRGDCCSVKGIARELAATGLGKLKNKKIESHKGTFDSKINWLVEAEKKSCPYILGRYFKNVKNVESPNWLKQRLISIGLKPISSLVDITNFLTFDLGRPLHVFDALKLNGNLTVRFSGKGEKILGLDKKIYSLEENDLVIADEDKVVSLAGIIGGENSSVDNNTKEVFLEVAYFDRNLVAISGRKHDILSDARYRFERGIDPNMMLHGINLASRLISSICGGEQSRIVEHGEVPNTKKNVLYRPKSFLKIVGIDLCIEKQKEILINLGFKIEEKNESEWNIITPSWRYDIEIENDIIEELARVYGYNNIPIIKLSKENSLPKNILSQVENKKFILRENMAYKGLNEIVSLAFNDSKKSNLFIENKEEVIIDNPISQELNSLRPSLIPNMLEAGSKNMAKGQESISFFELGYIYNGQEYKDQKINLTATRIGFSNYKNWHEKYRKFDVYDIKSDLFSCLEKLNIPNRVKITRNVPSYYHPGKSGEVKLGSQLLAYFGEIHPSVIKVFNLKEKALVFELFIENLPTINNKNINNKNEEFSSLMSLKRDFCFVLPKKVSAANLVDVIKKVERQNISAVRIFDVYEGNKTSFEQVSITVEVEINQGKKTLTIDQIDLISNNIIESVKKELNAKLR